MFSLFSLEAASGGDKSNATLQYPLGLCRVELYPKTGFIGEGKNKSRLKWICRCKGVWSAQLLPILRSVWRCLQTISLSLNQLLLLLIFPLVNLSQCMGTGVVHENTCFDNSNTTTSTCEKNDTLSPFPFLPPINANTVDCGNTARVKSRSVRYLILQNARH